MKKKTFLHINFLRWIWIIMLLFSLHRLVFSEDVPEGQNDGVHIDGVNPGTTSREKLYPDKSLMDLPDISVIVEIALVCDKKFGDRFHHNRTDISDHFTNYFWDLTMRFQTLRRRKISFRITSLTVIEKIEDQLFIENNRDNVTNFAPADKIIPEFRKWIHAKIGNLARFDVALLVTQAIQGGKALGAATACKMQQNDTHNLAAAAMDGSLTTGPHLLGHLFGAPHDYNFDWCEKNQCDCPYTVMCRNENSSGAPHFFSSCSDTHMSTYFGHKSGSCFQYSDGKVLLPPVIDPYYDNVLPPPVKDQCRKLFKTPIKNKTIPASGKRNMCDQFECHSEAGQNITFYPFYNTDCGKGHRCFQGKCIDPGMLLTNVGSGKCVGTKGDFFFGAEPEMVDCPISSTPFHRFIISDRDHKGKLLMMPFKLPYYHQQSDTLLDEYKCLSLRLTQEDKPEITMQNCSDATDLSGWDMIDLDNEEFLLKHKGTGECARSIKSGNIIQVDSSCDRNDPSFRWNFYLVFPTPGMCPEEDRCKADLRTTTTTHYDPITKVVTLEVGLKNVAGVAFAPAAIISTASRLFPVKITKNCFMWDEKSIKCKLGRLMKEGESANVGTIIFDVSHTNINKNEDVGNQLDISVTAEAAARLFESVKVKERKNEEVTNLWAVLIILCITVSLVAVGAMLQMYTKMKRNFFSV